ncbi:hypothetical protein MFIFM68171_08848 [Madurella fahalii]|uniref:Uncharacterized protein n=1 Tax=Madurella fahalii TaxID=1157608 RepID=A0ABQ0GLI9_9PEZI
MSVCAEVKRLYASLQEMIGLRRRKGVKHPLQISEPFNFKKETTTLPGFTEDEIAVLREKAAASRLGIADVGADAFASTKTRSALLTPARLSGPLPPLPLAPSSSSAPRSGTNPFLVVPVLPIPIPGSGSGASSRRSSHHRSGSSSLRSSSTAATNLTAATTRWPARVAATHSMNDLLLLGAGGGGGGGPAAAAAAAVQLAAGPSAGGAAGAVSSLDLDFDLDLDLNLDVMEMEREFDLSLDMEFELGGCRMVSPLSPSMKGSGLVGKKGRFEV